MYSVEKSFTFEAAHRLMQHDGKCAFIHGHHYVVTIGLEDVWLNTNYMVKDFSDIKDHLKPIIDKMDHGIILNKKDDVWVTTMTLRQQKVYLVDGEPTAEFLAEHFFYLCKNKFPQIKYVIVQETPTSIAKFRYPGQTA